MTAFADSNPFAGITYGAALSRLARQYGDREALTFRERRYSFAALKAEADAVSARLTALGLRPGDKLALWLPNTDEYVFLWLGACQIGIVAMMLNTRLKRDEIAYQLKQSDSRALMVAAHTTFRDFLGDVADLCPEIRDTNPAGFAGFPELRHVVCCDDPPAELPGLTAWASVVAADDAAMPPLATQSTAPALLSYSSGTTALPKGVLVTHCIWQKAWDMAARLDWTKDDCLYLTIPMFGSMATMNGFLQSWVYGGRVILGEHFDATRCLITLHEERPTVIHLLPTMARQICAHPERSKYDTTSLRVAFVLSIDETVLGMVEDDMGLPSVLTGYGMTETSTVVCRNRWDDPREVRFTTQGKPLPGLAIMIADADGAPLPAGTMGEILVRGYAVTPGYYRKPGEYAKAMRSDGWFRTGDKGFLTPEGRISFQGRIGDDYKSRGFNVSPSEIEAVLVAHPSVSQAAVVGIPDAEHGTAGVAFVIRERGQQCDESELLAELFNYMRQKLASYKVPTQVIFVDAYPLTEGTGKVQKFKLREIALQKTADPTRHSP